MIINASPLIIFGKVNRIDLLKKVCGTIHCAQAVYTEVVVEGMKKNKRDAHVMSEYLHDNTIKVFTLDAHHHKIAEKIILREPSLHTGEAETIALALQLKEKEILIDEKIAREIAHIYGITPRGSLRILLTAYDQKFLTVNELKKLFEEMLLIISE